jgi:hypothetical protein
MLCTILHITHEYVTVGYVGCPESIRPFWISREPVAWCWCNLAARHRRPYCAFMNSRSPVGLVSRQWDVVYRSCVLCDHRIHNGQASRSASSRQYTCPFYTSRAGFFFGKHHITQVCQHPCSPYLAPCNFWLFPKPKSLLKVRFVNATVTQYIGSVSGVSLPTD